MGCTGLLVGTGKKKLRRTQAKMPGGWKKKYFGQEKCQQLQHFMLAAAVGGFDEVIGKHFGNFFVNGKG